MAQVTASPEMKNYEDKKDIVTLHNKGWVIMIIFKALREMVQRWDPKIVFLMETKLKMSAMKREKENAGFVFGLIVPKAENCAWLFIFSISSLFFIFWVCLFFFFFLS